MKYIYQNQYGNAGGVHTAKPIYKMNGNSVYATENHPQGASDKAMFRVRGGKMFSTEHNPNHGASPHALFEVKGDKIHTTAFHPAHNPTTHMYNIKPHF